MSKRHILHGPVPSFNDLSEKGKRVYKIMDVPDRAWTEAEIKDEIRQGSTISSAKEAKKLTNSVEGLFPSDQPGSLWDDRVVVFIPKEDSPENMWKLAKHASPREKFTSVREWRRDIREKIANDEARIKRREELLKDTHEEFDSLLTCV